MSRARINDLSSEIAELRRRIPSRLSASSEEQGAVMPSGGWDRLAELLAEMAIHHVVVGEHESARRAALDALVLVDMIADERVWAGISLRLGEVLLEVFEARRACERFEAAILIFDRHSDLASGARARLGRARAFAALHDPIARALLEDAGIAFEDLGDHEAARLIDREIREVSAVFEESPASFNAAGRARAASIAWKAG